MNLQEKLNKIDSEIYSGLKFRATDRLRNLIQVNPNEMALWNKLAEIYYESGFLDAAGKYWILTEQTEDRKKNVWIFMKSLLNIQVIKFCSTSFFGATNQKYLNMLNKN